MKQLFAVFLAVCMAFSLTACNMDGKDVHRFLSGLAEELGESQITEDNSLIGARSLAGDAYTGDYTAECSGDTGRDVVFGGGSVKARRLHVYGTVSCNSGRAAVRIRQNETVITLEPDQNGSFETILSCSSGGNYIMVDYTDFQGKLKLHSENFPDGAD